MGPATFPNKLPPCLHFRPMIAKQGMFWKCADSLPSLPPPDFRPLSELCFLLCTMGSGADKW